MIKKCLWMFGPLALIALLGVTTSGYPSYAFFSHVVTTAPAGTVALTLNSAGAANFSRMDYQLGGTTKAITGVSGAANDIITGAVQNDYNTRSAGGNILFSVDNGGSASWKIATNGALSNLAPSSGPAITLTNSSGADAILINCAGAANCVDIVQSSAGAAAIKVAGTSVGDVIGFFAQSTTTGDTVGSFNTSGATQWTVGSRRSDGALVFSTGLTLGTPKVVIPNTVTNGSIQQTAVGSWLQGVSTCTGQGTPRGMTCVTNAAGTQSTITFSPAFATTPTCNLNGSQSTAVQQNTISTPSTSGVVIVTTSPMTFYLQCSV